MGVKNFMLWAFLCTTMVNAVRFDITNREGGPVWVGIQGNPGHEHLRNGGFVLNQGQTTSVNAPDNWAGRFWPRTWCDPNSKHCMTGDCGNRVECAGAGGVPPATLLEIKLKGDAGLDYYDISHLPPFFNFFIGQYNSPSACDSRRWPVNYPGYFKGKCPAAYSYAQRRFKHTAHLCAARRGEARRKTVQRIKFVLYNARPLTQAKQLLARQQVSQPRAETTFVADLESKARKFSSARFACPSALWSAEKLSLFSVIFEIYFGCLFSFVFQKI
ncbi:pathogenesis-related protein 5-like [Sitophilus oryzae]|uniref:Pathogenesis-related protein 5-like n=1 Tax=Sitophilus oryzae TaxID=7048 RepID=A0A6J2Y375_SITOR|nr:pathogenesis-related protein 5-like [Sitophilus oryzae]